MTVAGAHQHLRNIVLNAAALGATGFLKDELGDSLDDFSAFERMSVDGMDLIRAIFKELASCTSRASTPRGSSVSSTSGGRSTRPRWRT